MASHVDNATLREAPTSADLAHHLRQISRELPTERVTDDLLAAIKSEALPPDVYAIHLSIVDSPAALVAALRQPFSRFVRCAAIKQFGRSLKKSSWESVWNEIGGTSGLLQLLSELSVLEVDLFCKVIGWATRESTKESTLKQQRVTELLHGLLPKYFPESHHQSQDDRPLQNRYAGLLPSCTPEFIQELLTDYGGPFELDQWPIRRVTQSHWYMLQGLALRTLKPDNSSAKAKFGSQNVADRDFLNKFLPYLLREIPQTKGHTQEFSASMSFSLEVLRVIAQGEHLHFDEENFGPLLVMPLVRRALSRKVNLHSFQEILDLTLLYLERHPQGLGASLSWHETSFLAYVAKAWSTQSRVLEKQLVAALKLLPLGRHTELPELDGVFKAVNRKDRYDLLHLIMFHTNDWKSDINSDIDIQRLPIKQWPLSLFQTVSLEKAHRLLDRLIRLKPEGDFLQLQSIHWRPRIEQSILAQPPSPGLGYGDPLLLSILLRPNGREATQDSQKAVKHQQERSSKSRDQAMRAFHAKSAAFYAIASGSLDLYAQVLIWLRRYVHDPLTLTTIFSSETTNTKEGIALLSGIPRDLSHYKTEDICALVIKANDILVSILETAILAMNEPSFNPRDWKGPKSLFWDVVAARFMQWPRLKNALSLTEDTVYNILWVPTLEMLLKVEKIGLQPGHESLSFNLPNGPLVKDWPDQDLVRRLKFGNAGYRFLDNLARARNDIWVEHRPTLFPDCASLPNGWPRGLPIQALVGDFISGIHTHAANSHTPYLYSRADAVVSLKQNPVVEEATVGDAMRNAIGGFVDRFETALEIKVLQQKPGSAQEDQASAIIARVVELCCDSESETEDSRRLSKDEAIDLCKRFFAGALRNLKVALIDEADDFHSKGYPVLPQILQNSDIQEHLEWNPIEGRPQKDTTRQVTATLLECMIEATNFVSLSPFRIPHVFVKTPRCASVWREGKIANLKREGRIVEESTIVSTLLFLESRIAMTPKILRAPFPSAQDIRYPPLFLDQEFLEDSKNEELMARQAISHLKRKVPSTLLQILTENALDALSNPRLIPTESSSRDRTAYGLLRLLLQSDRPELASHGILTTLIDHPEASSWHRQILKKSFLRTLSRSQARKFVDSVTSSVHAKLDEQTRLRESGHMQGQASVGSSSPSKPIIKVTTIKFLAQFLNDADALSIEASVKTLSDLMLKSSHVDVRVAVIESLISKLERCGDESDKELENQIFQAFEENIPIMASLNKNRVLEEEDWKLAEQTDNLPDVIGDGTLTEIAPIFGTFCSKLRYGDVDARRLLDRVLLPALKESQVNNKRWMAIFAKLFGLESRIQELPALPARPEVLIELIKSNSHIPSWILDLHHQHALISLKSPPWLRYFSKKVRNDTDLRDSNAVRYWLSLYNRGPDLIMESSASLTSFLRNKYFLSIAAEDPASIQIPHAQKFLIDGASALLWLRDPDFKEWNKFLSHFDLPFWKHDSWEDRAAWIANTRPVIEHIISVVDGIRGSEEWQRNPFKTETPFLPSTFPLRLLLLDYPQLHLKSPRIDSIAVFSGQILALVKEVHILGVAHRDKLVEIAAAVNRTEREDKIPLACLIGRVEESSDTHTMEEFELRTELADNLVRDLWFEGGEKERVTALLRWWVRSRFEGVRMRGVRAGRRMALDVEEEGN